MTEHDGESACGSTQAPPIPSALSGISCIAPDPAAYNKASDGADILPAGKTLSVNGGQAAQLITLDRLDIDAASSQNPLMARIDLPPENQAPNYYTIEARRAVGYDRALAPGLEGVVVHEVTIAGRTIDNVPYSGFPKQGVEGAITLAVGDGFYDSAAGVAITVVAQTPTGYQVAVGLPSVTSVSPTLGPEAGNQAVTIRGRALPTALVLQ